MLQTAVLLALLAVSGALGGVQNYAGSGYLPDTEYVYSYSSATRLFMGVNVSVEAEVAVEVVADTGDSVELLLFFKEPRVSWVSGATGTHMNQAVAAFGDLSQWFSIQKETSGRVSQAFYPTNEAGHSLAFKKSIAQMLSLDMQAGEREFDGTNLIVHLQTAGSGFGKDESKVAVYDRTGLLLSVEVVEIMEPKSDSEEHGLFEQHIHAQSKLSYKEHNERVLQLQRPSDLIAAALVISKPRVEVPLLEIHTKIQERLVCASDELACMKELTALLKSLSDRDLETLVSKYFEPASPDPLALPLLDALTYLDSPIIPHLIAVQVLTPEMLLGSEDLVFKTLFHLASGAIQPSSEVIEAVLTLLSRTEGLIHNRALLTLGAMAKSIQVHNPALYSEIVSLLHILLEQHTGHPHPETLAKSRRSLTPSPSSYDSLRHAVIVDALGNAGAQESIPTLAQHATRESVGFLSKTALSVQHASVKALRHFNCEESANILLQVVDSSPHPTLQHSAARAYQAHSRRKRDLSELLNPRRTTRSRRQVSSPQSVVSEVTMPVVSWNTQFGEPNISTDLGRTVLNNFTIESSTLTSSYEFSIHDEVSFETNMLLSDGEEHRELLRTEFCLQGEAKYDVNILTDYRHNLTAYQFEYYTSTVNALTAGFQTSYDDIVASEQGYTGLRDSIYGALDDIGVRFGTIESLLADFMDVSESIGVDFELKTEGISLLAAITATLADTYQLASASQETIGNTADALLPSLPRALTASLSVDGLPFTTSTFYLPYLPYAPQKAMANIFTVYRKCGEAFTNLQTVAESLMSLTNPNGANYQWLSPGLFLRTESDSIVSLIESLSEAIDEAEKNPDETYDGVPLADLRALQQAVLVYLQPALTSLENFGESVINEWEKLVVAFDGSKNGYGLFTRAYERARSDIDVVFGQRFHPEFPWQLRSCNSYSGCGSYPSTSDGRYQSGIDLLVNADTLVAAPLSGYVQLMDPSSTPEAYRNTSVLVIPAESSFSDFYFIVANIIPNIEISDQPVFFRSGSPIGTVDTSFQLSNQTFIHVEAYKSIDGLAYGVNPSQFLQPNLDPDVQVSFECNDFVTYIGGAVVDRRPISPSETEIEYIGEPLVQDIPGHEFPQPHDLVLESEESQTSNAHVEFFQSSTFLMVGPIPVQFDFSAAGQYQLNYSLSAGLLSKKTEALISPYLHARAEGTMTVGSTQFARVELSGSLVETLLPMRVEQDFSMWPLKASSLMDLALVPSTLTLSTQLIQLTGAGEFASQEVLESENVWEYVIPPLNRDEFYYEGVLEDNSAPVFLPLNYTFNNQSGCFVRQLPGRSYDNPAFELEFNLEDEQSLLDVTMRVGTFTDGGDLVSEQRIGGRRIVVPNDLVLAQEIIFTVAAVNLNGLKTLSACNLFAFDRSPPLARINPIQPISSHPSKIDALVAAFDEYVLDSTLEIAIGSVPGGYGTDVLSWTTFDTSRIYTPPDMAGDVMNLFSFPRSGRLLGGILQSVSSLDQVDDCATMCSDDGSCKSFDYSRLESICILHDNIEGPSTSGTDFENVFYTPPLQTSASYSHYEKLGVGNSTLVEYSGLSLENNRLYYITMRLRNSLGYTNLASSSGFLIDLTPPSPGKIRAPVQDALQADGCAASVIIPGCMEYSGAANHRVIVDGIGSGTVFNGPIPLLDTMYTSTSNYITANWDGFDDAETGIYGYTWCIGTTVGTCDILSPTDPHSHLSSQESWTNSGLATFEDLSDGSYFITVQAVSNVAYGGPLVTSVRHSTAYILDTTPPVLSGIEVVSYNESTNELVVLYNASDSESGIDSISVALGLTEDDTGVMDWNEVGSDEEGEVTLTVYIEDGVQAWVKVRAINQAGLQTIAVAANSPVMVDRTPPVVGYIFDGLSDDIDYQSSLTTICINIGGLSDPMSGIAAVQWGIGFTHDTFSVRPLTALSPQQLATGAACDSGLNLMNNVSYFSTIIVTNGAGLNVIVSSDGVHTDTTAPVQGYLNAGLDSDSSLQYSSSLTTVTANWGGFTDYESGVSHYGVRIEVQKFGTAVYENVHSQVIESASNSITWNYFSFVNGDKVRITLEVFNGAELSTELSTEYTIDLTLPELDYILDGLNQPHDAEYQSDSSSISAIWSIGDSQSGIARIEGSIYELREGRRILVHPDPVFTDDLTVVIPSHLTAWHVNGLSLNTGSRYIVALDVTNGAGLSVRYESNGITVDTTPPVVSSVSIMGDTFIGDDATESVVTIANPNFVEAYWTANDPETGILMYYVGIVDENSTIIAIGGENYTSFGTATGGTIENMNLVPNQEYRVAVVAVNLAGQQSEPSFSALFRVVEGLLDAAGYVSVGQDIESVGDFYTDETTAITAYFDGFVSQSCGGISRYEWAIGEDDSGSGRESVLAFTDSGVVVIGAGGSGYAQVLLPDLADQEGKPLYVTVRGITGCGDILETTSGGIIIDPSPPTLDIIRSGTRAVEDVQSSASDGHEDYQNVGGFSTVWLNEDKESDIQREVLIKIGTYPGGGDIESETTVTENYIRRNIEADEGIPNYVTVTGTNRAGLETTISSLPVVLDTTPPLAGELNCNPHGVLEPTFFWNSESNAGTIYCSWKGVLDSQSGIAFYSVAIGTAPGDESLLSRTNLAGSSTSFSSPLLTVDADTQYYVTLYATNGAGLESSTVSDQIYFDNTPPLLEGSVFVVSNIEIASYDMGSFIVNDSFAEVSAVCLIDTDVVGIAFQDVSDPQSSIIRYEIGVRYSVGNADLLPYQAFEPTVFAEGILFYYLTPVFLSVAGREAVYFSVKAFNREGIYSVLSSNPVFVKAGSTALPNLINDGGNRMLDIDYQTSTTTLSGYFQIGVNCPLRSAQWSVETVDGTVVQDTISISIPEPASNSVENAFLLSTDQVQLYNDETYRILVQAVDSTGEVYILQSNGMTVTTQSVKPGLVQDGPIPGQDLNYQESTSVLYAHWSDFGDGSPQQMIARYEVAAGSDRGYPNTRSDIAPFINVGLNTNYSFTDLDLIPQSIVYYVTVRAYTVSGAYVDVTSNGITAGYGDSIVPGFITTPQYQFDTGTLTAYWNEFESDLPIRSYEWALGSRPPTPRELEILCSSSEEEGSGILGLDAAVLFDEFEFVFVNLDTSATATDLDLRHGTTYYVTIRAIDQGDKCIAVVSDGTLIDTTPPIAKSVSLNRPESLINILDDSNYVVYIRPFEDLTVTWDEFIDEETGVTKYEVAIFEQEVCGSTFNSSLEGEAPVVDFRVVGSDLKTTFEGISFEVGVPYVVVVRGSNAVGLTSNTYSRPLLLDNAVAMAGTVKDGVNWEGDLVFQSNLSMLSTVFTHAKLPPQSQSVMQQSGPCPEEAFYSLSEFDSSWSSMEPSEIIGVDTTTAVYEQGQVTPSIDPSGIKITAVRDRVSTNQQIITGTYQTQVHILNGDTVSFDILAAFGTPAFEEFAVTSVVFIDSGASSDLLALFELGLDDVFDYPDTPAFSAFGIQIHHSAGNESSDEFTPQRVVMWAKDASPIRTPYYVVREVEYNLSVAHTYTVNFLFQQLDIGYTRKAELSVDGTRLASLQGLPSFSNNTRMVFHVYNRLGFVPAIEVTFDDPTVEAVFANVSLPFRNDHICDFGLPFYSESSPIVEFRAGVGTSPTAIDVKELEVVLQPCHPCLPGPCTNYSCQLNCTQTDPYTIPVTLYGLSLSPGYSNVFNLSGQDGPDTANENADNTMLTHYFQPMVYYIIIEAVTASGQTIHSASNGITIDTSPPEQTVAIEHFDVSFSETEPTNFQGDESTISAQWGFRDLESGIIEYSWAIGTYPYGQDIQGFESVGLESRAENPYLFGILQHNTTYYVTVTATNGAGLTVSASSSGITLITSELNRTQLVIAFQVEFSDTIVVVRENESAVEVLLTRSGDMAAVSWTGAGDDVEDVFWFIGSELESKDIFPRTEVSFGDGTSAAIANGTLYIDAVAFANISEIIALAEEKQEDPLDNGLFIEPGRLFYHSLEFCNFVHRCTIIEANPSIVFRVNDAEETSQSREDVRLTITQDATPQTDPPALDKAYTVTIETGGGLNLNAKLFAGFLSEADVTRRYRVSTPYISNPYETMAQTSRQIARRFTEIGGPSFYVSFLGQDNLFGPLSINATYDSSLDWSIADPELAYWDIDSEQWTEVGATCLTNSVTDTATSTIAVEACSTVLDSSVSRPSSLSRRKRQTLSNDAGSGSGDLSVEPVDFLDRPVQFIVIRIGNLSTNTAPRLMLPEDPLLVMEDMTFTQQLIFSDDEGDVVDFYLSSVPQLGSVTLTQDGLISYTPCPHCIGMDVLKIYIMERPFSANTIPLFDCGELRIEILNVNREPHLLVYSDVTGILNENSSSTITSYVEANRTIPVTVALVAAFDYDGYHDDLEVSITQGSLGLANYAIWLDAVNTPESLPVQWTPNTTVSSYTGYIAFVGASITYLPNSVGNDEVRVIVRDTRGVFSNTITVSIEVLPSWCLNDGVCGGSDSDPNCTDIEARRSGFGGYNCTCLPSYEGPYCENQTQVATTTADTVQTRICPLGIPLIECDGDPCAGAVCPSHPDAECRPNFCGSCSALWYDEEALVDCTVGTDSNVCYQLLTNEPAHIIECLGVTCECPELPYNCPDDSIIVEVRHSNCCVSYQCSCPDISCPLFMECGNGVQPIPDYRGNNFPGRCCPSYHYDDINECLASTENMCSDDCMNTDFSYSCSCPAGTTLAQDGLNCGVCYYNGMEYLLGDRVKIGCNWCLCRGDSLSGERWHCTADPCDPMCIRDGQYYPINHVEFEGALECTCRATDASAEWSCDLDVI